MRKNIIALFFGLCFCFIILEIILRVFNPFAFRVKYNSICLPANQSCYFINNFIPGIDKEIRHTKNSLGFRGHELPKDFTGKLSIIAVGGSTTECFYISDGNDWPNLLEKKLNDRYKDIWLNNAGLDGHSTFGHTVLLTDYLIKLKPKIILFLIGANDVERSDLNRYDQSCLNNQINGIREIVKRSEVLIAMVNICRYFNARNHQLAHSDVDFLKPKFLEIPQSLIQKKLEEQKHKYLEGYRQRILRLINICRENRIDPIFITQPSLFGEGFDKTTGINLETIEVSDSVNGKLSWDILQLYNDVLMEAGRSNNCLVIDLAVLMPKYSLYFYDRCHFTNEGSKKVADIVYNKLRQYLDKKYSGFVKAN